MLKISFKIWSCQDFEFLDILCHLQLVVWFQKKEKSRLNFWIILHFAFRYRYVSSMWTKKAIKFKRCIPCCFFDVKVKWDQNNFEKTTLRHVRQETLGKKVIWFSIKATKRLTKNVNRCEQLKHFHVSLWKLLSFSKLLNYRWLSILMSVNWPLWQGYVRVCL